MRLDAASSSSAPRIGRRGRDRWRRDRHECRVSPRRGGRRCGAGRACAAWKRLDAPRRRRRPHPVLGCAERRDREAQSRRVSGLWPATRAGRSPSRRSAICSCSPGSPTLRRSSEASRCRMSVAWIRGSSRPQETRALCPLLEGDDILAGAFSPGDGHATPEDVVQGYAVGARAHGAHIEVGCEVVAINTSGAEITEVVTSHGSIRTTR